MREKSHFQEMLKLESKLLPLTYQDINFYNMLQIYGSNRFVFCSENRFELVEEVCQTYPHVCSTDKNRIKVNEIQ